MQLVHALNVFLRWWNCKVIIENRTILQFAKPKNPIVEGDWVMTSWRNDVKNEQNPIAKTVTNRKLRDVHGVELILFFNAYTKCYTRVNHARPCFVPCEKR